MVNAVIAGQKRQFLGRRLQTHIHLFVFIAGPDIVKGRQAGADTVPIRMNMVNTARAFFSLMSFSTLANTALRLSVSNVPSEFFFGSM